MGARGQLSGRQNVRKRRPCTSTLWDVRTTRMLTQIAPCAMIPFRRIPFRKIALIAQSNTRCVLLIAPRKYWGRISDPNAKDMDSLPKRIAQRYAGSKQVALNQDFWLTPSDVAEICPPCAARMANLKIRRVRASTLFGQDMLKLAATAHTVEAWNNLPEGWTDEGRRKFWEAIGGSVQKCMAKVAGHVTDPSAFADALKNRIESLGWRGIEEKKR